MDNRIIILFKCLEALMASVAICLFVNMTFHYFCSSRQARYQSLCLVVATRRLSQDLIDLSGAYWLQRKWSCRQQRQWSSNRSIFQLLRGNSDKLEKFLPHLCFMIIFSTYRIQPIFALRKALVSYFALPVRISMFSVQEEFVWFPCVLKLPLR